MPGEVPSHQWLQLGMKWYSGKNLVPFFILMAHLVGSNIRRVLIMNGKPNHWHDKYLWTFPVIQILAIECISSLSGLEPQQHLDGTEQCHNTLQKNHSEYIVTLWSPKEQWLNIQIILSEPCILSFCRKRQIYIQRWSVQYINRAASRQSLRDFA